MKLLVFLFFTLILLNGFSQKDKEKILANFDYVEYYPDSTIHAAHKFTGVTLERFTVEFNAFGTPVAMGKYQKGKKVGKWIYSDGSLDNFSESERNSNTSAIKVDLYPDNSSGKTSGSLHPGCGTGRMQQMQEFRKTYESLLNPETK